MIFVNRPDLMCFKCSVAQVCSLNCAKQVFQLPVRDLCTWRREQRTAVSCQAIIRTQRRTMCYVSHRLFRQSRACKHVAQQRSMHAHPEASLVPRPTSAVPRKWLRRWVWERDYSEAALRLTFTSDTRPIYAFTMACCSPNCRAIFMMCYGLVGVAIGLLVGVVFLIHPQFRNVNAGVWGLVSFACAACVSFYGLMRWKCWARLSRGTMLFVAVGAGGTALGTVGFILYIVLGATDVGETAATGAIIRERWALEACKTTTVSYVGANTCMWK